jgi:6-phosphogluconolactonase
MIAGVGICLAAAALSVDAADKDSGSELVYIGTRGASAQDAPGTQHGIYAARLDLSSGHLTPLGLVADLNRATWFVHHPKLPVIYTVGLEGKDMNAESRLVSYEVNAADGKLRELNRVGSGGSVSAVPVQADGKLGEVASLQKDYGTGPNRRQGFPQAHGLAIDGSHRYVISADFGADRLFVYHFNPRTRALSPADPAFEALPPGSGPRHIVFHPNGRFAFLATELSAELRSYGWNPATGKLQPVQTYSPFPADFTGDKSAGELALSRDGRFLYLSLRGDADSVVVLAVDPRKGTLTEVQRTSSLGKTPWSFAIDPSGRWMVVTNAGAGAVAGSVTVLKVDPASGRLSPTSESLPLPSPVTVVFHPG